MPSLTSRTFPITPVLAVIPDDWRARAPGAFAHHQHSERPWHRSSDPYWGWVARGTTDGPCNSESLFVGDYFCLSLRIDAKKVTSSSLRLEVARSQNQIAIEKGLERLRGPHKREIAEAVEEDLRAQAPLSYVLVDILVDLATGVGVVVTSNPAHIDAMCRAWKATTNTHLDVMPLAGWLGMKDADIDVPSLLLAAVTGACREVGDWTIDMGERAWLLDFGAVGRKVAVVERGGASGSPVVKAGIAQDVQQIHGAILDVTKGELTYTCRLALTPGGARLDQVRLPAVVNEGEEEMVLEMAYLLGDLREGLSRFVAAAHAAPVTLDEVRAWAS